MIKENKKSRVTFRRLLLAKRLFLHGLEHSHSVGDLNKIIAIHNFHNSIEITLKCIVLHYGIKTEKQMNIDFESLLNQIDNYDEFKKKNQRLPYRQEIRNLNQIRNLVQHHAVEPETSTMEDWRVFSKIFLVRVFDEYFSYNFDDISSVTLIDDDRLQQLLQCSWIRLTKRQWFESIFLSKISFMWASSKIYDFLPSKGQNSKFPATSRISSNVRHLTSDGGQQIVKTVETLFDRIRETEHFTAILSSGIKLLDFKQFEESSPAIAFAGGGKPYSFRRKEYTDDQAKWVHSFVVDAIVNWQFLGLNPTVPEWAIKGFEGIISEETQKDV